MLVAIVSAFILATVISSKGQKFALPGVNGKVAITGPQVAEIQTAERASMAAEQVTMVREKEPAEETIFPQEGKQMKCLSHKSRRL